MPFQKGNKDAAKPRLIYNAIRRHLVQNPEDARLMVEALVNLAKKGDVRAFGELTDRLEGKATQVIDANVSEGGEARFTMTLSQLQMIAQGTKEPEEVSLN